MANIIDRYLADAEKSKDPCRIAFCILGKAERAVTSDSFNYKEVDEMLKRCKEVEKQYKPWLLSWFRKPLTLKSQPIKKCLEAARQRYPADYATRDVDISSSALMGAFPKSEVITRRHWCAHCQSDRGDLMCCSAVSFMNFILIKYISQSKVHLGLLKKCNHFF